jgi:hypothetical protein
LQFQATHLATKIQQWAFEALKPYFVKPCKKHNVYCCKYHVELDMLRQGLNNIKHARKGTHVKNACGCECFVCKLSNPNSHLCQAHDKVYFGVTMLWEERVCPKLKLQKWHKLECLIDYPQCKVNIFPICPNESSPSNWLVSWRCFEL